MRSRFAGFVIACLASATASAQTPVQMKTLGASWDFRVSAFLMPTTRLLASSDDDFSTASGSVKGGEIYWRAVNGGGLRFRYMTSARTKRGDVAAALRYLDATAMMGSRKFAVELGYLHRDEALAAGDSSIGLVQLGWRTEVKVGTSGVSLGIRGAYMREPKIPESADPGQEKEPVIWGILAETWASYVPPTKYPIFGQLGFRRETRSQTGATKRPEEMTSMFFAIGYQTSMRR